jgi:hypothetical protein
MLAAAAVATGAGVQGRHAAAKYGVLAAGVWLAQAEAARRGEDRLRHPDFVWVNGIFPLSLIASSLMGSCVGSVTLRARSADQTLERLEAHRGRLEVARTAMERGVTRYGEALDRWVAARPPDEDEAVTSVISAAADRSRDRASEITAAFEAGETIRRGAPLADLLGAIERAYRRGDLRVDVSLPSDPLPELTPEERFAIDLFVRRSFNNAKRHAGATSVVIRVRVSDVVEVEVENPGRSRTLGPVGLGKGSTHSLEALEDVGGGMELVAEADRFRARAWVPGAGAEADPVGAIAAELTDEVERGAWDFVRICGLMVLLSAWCSQQYLSPHRRRSQVLSTAGVIAAEAVRRLPVGTRENRTAATVLGGAALSAALPHGDFTPLAGWTAWINGTHAVQASRPVRVLGLAALLAGANIVSFRGRSEDFAAMAARDGVGMNGGVCLALLVRRAFQPVVDRERQLRAIVAEMEQLHLTTNQVAFVSHNFHEPVLNVIALRGATPETAALNDAARAVERAAAEIDRRLNDRRELIDELVETLARRVYPVPVDYEDLSSELTATPSRLRELGVRRRVLDAIAGAADLLDERYPAGMWGQRPFGRLQLRISETGDGRLRVRILPRHIRGDGQPGMWRIAEAVGALGGTVEPSESEPITFSLEGEDRSPDTANSGALRGLNAGS